MSLITDAKTIFHMAFTGRSGDSQEQRLENFYSAQAENYDHFRKKLLHGREATIAALNLPTNAVVVDVGGGTGANLDALNVRQMANIRRWTVLDLCSSLLNIAQARIEANNLSFATIVKGDACHWQPPDPVDAIVFSYSATMIPDWLGAFENAYQMLKPGGQIAVVDFYVSRKFSDGPVKHSALTRHFWPFWFAWDNVFISQDHLPWLQRHFAQTYLFESAAALPYLPFTRVPYYAFVGRKPNSQLAPAQ
jgi:S-adenosylmethionine-diacylgycerolhomoserine-N-methlytransferase